MIAEIIIFSLYFLSAFVLFYAGIKFFAENYETLSFQKIGFMSALLTGSSFLQYSYNDVPFWLPYMVGIIILFMIFKKFPLYSRKNTSKASFSHLHKNNFFIIFFYCSCLILLLSRQDYMVFFDSYMMTEYNNFYLQKNGYFFY